MVDSGLRGVATSDGGDGAPSASLPPIPSVAPQRMSTELPRPVPPDKRYLQAQKPLETPPPKRSGFGLFGKFKEDDDSRDQLKRLKADNKRLREQLQNLEIKSNQLGAEN